ncbi:MAG: P-II family nitrogen regulator [Nitrososphaeraceae archaeon]
MKQIDIYIAWENVSAATDVLHMHGVGGISLSEVKGRGKIPHEAVPHTIQAYTYEKKMGPEYVSRVRMSTIVPDSKVKPVIDDLLKLPPTRGKVFVRDVLEAYDLASKTAGESAIL